MRKLRAFWLRITALFHRRAWENDLDEELNSNVELHVEDNVRTGMSPQEARRAARIRFGSIVAAKDGYRDRKVIPSLANLLRDVRFSSRSLRKNKGFSLAVIAMLALCIGANATVLSALYSLILKPLPVKDPERLVQLFNLRENRSPDNPYSESSWIQYVDLRRRSNLFEGVALRSRAAKLIERGGVVQRLMGQRATAEFFALMGVEPILGRFFLPDEVGPGQATWLFSLRHFGKPALTATRMSWVSRSCSTTRFPTRSSVSHRAAWKLSTTKQDSRSPTTSMPARAIPRGAATTRMGTTYGCG